jgi:DNA-binding GntR family transcriptional regulator
MSAAEGLRRLDEVTTVEELAFREIRDAILSGRLEPGSRLRLRELAATLGVSSLPVRAALLRLRSEGLVAHVPHSGSIVAPLEFEELEEIQAFRTGIEGLASRLGAERLTEAELARMEQRLTELRRVALKADLDRYLEAEWAFREICFEASGRERLVGYVVDLRRRAERYLRVAFASPSGLAESLRYQETFCDACRRRDGVAAEAVTRSALEWLKEAIRPAFV